MRKALAATVALVVGCFLTLGSAAAAFATPISITIDGASTLSIDADDSDSVQQVKQKIFDQSAIPVADQTLTFEGTILADGRTLADYNIQGGSTLTLLLTPQWTDNVLATPVLGGSYSDFVAASGGDISYAIVAGNLPLGLTLDAESGEASGVVTESGPYGFTVSARNLVGSIEQAFSGEIAAAVITPTPEPPQEPTPRPAIAGNQNGDKLAETGTSVPLTVLLAAAFALLLGAGLLATSRTAGSAAKR